MNKIQKYRLKKDLLGAKKGEIYCYSSTGVYEDMYKRENDPESYVHHSNAEIKYINSNTIKENPDWFEEIYEKCKCKICCCCGGRIN